MTETMTQEALLDLIEEYADRATQAALAASLVGGVGPEQQEKSDAHLALLRAVRSLPIEAGR